MAVQNRLYWLRHIILISVSIIVLFPIVWVATTSIRRDNAAFSTKLFSNRYTFQNYIDLLMPPRNLPVLLSEMQNLINISQRFAGMNEQELQRDFDWLYGEFNRQLDRSLNLMNEAQQDRQHIMQWVQEQQRFHERRFEELKPQEKSRLEAFQQQLTVNWTQDQWDLHGYQLMVAYGKAEPERQVVLLHEIDRIFPNLKPLREESQSQLQKLALSQHHMEASFSEFFEQDDTHEAWLTLKEALEETKAMVMAADFSLSRWNREVNLRLLNRVATALRSVLSEEEMGRFTALRDELRGYAQQVEGAHASYLDVFQEDFARLEARYQTLFADPIGKYEAINRSLTQKMADQNRVQGQVQDLLKQELLTEDTLDVLQKSLLLNINAFFQAFSIIENTVPRVTRLEDPGFVSRAQSVFDTLERTASLIDAIHLEFFDEEMVIGLKELESMIDFMLTNQEIVMENLGYSKIRDSIQAINNSSLILLPRVEDLVTASQRLAENRAKVVELREKAIQIENELIQLTHETERQGAIAASIQASSREVVLRIESLYLSYALSTAVDFSSLIDYILQVRRHREAYGRGGMHAYREDLWMHDTYDLFDLIQTTDLFGRGHESLVQLTNTLKNRLQSFEELSGYYIRLKLSGSPIVISEFNEINSIFTRGFEEVSSMLNRVGRRVSDLSEKEAFEGIDRHLRNQDRLIFDMTQIWYRKPEQQFVRWLFNSIVIALLVAMFSVIVCSLGAYPFSRMRFRGRKYGLMGLLLIQMFPTATMGIIALYSLLRFLGQVFPPMGLDTLGGLTFVYLGGSIAFNMWLIKGYFDTIPTSLEEAAMIDGSTRLQTFWRIVLPLAMPVLAVVFILGFMGIFNEFLLARIILQSPQNYTYPVGLQTFAFGPYQTDWGLFTAAALLGAIPMVLLFLLMQNYIVSGLTKGAEKG